MPQTTRTFRVFVSSTFDDLKAERNALQERVFPRLKALCTHGTRFQAIDLRWGVSEEAGRDQQTMAICLDEVKRCQKASPKPNFIVLLGDRYGWCPLPASIQTDEFTEILKMLPDEDQALLAFDETKPEQGNGWYRKDKNSLRSAYRLRERKVAVPEAASGEQKKAAQDEEATWKRDEASMRGALRKAIDALGWAADDERRIKYEASATEQEILRGALGVPDANKHVFGFFRTISNLKDLVADIPDKPPAGEADPDLPPPEKHIDLTAERVPDKAAHARLDDLKRRLAAHLPDNVRDRYRASWELGQVSRDHLDQLCDDVYEALAGLIKAEIAQLEETPDLEKEIKAHDRFGKDRVGTRFVGRLESLERIRTYIESGDNHPLAVVGGSGSGKSALIAAVARQARESTPDAVVVRFIGATPQSSIGSSLLYSLCRQLARRYAADGLSTTGGEERQHHMPRSEADIPADYRELSAEFPRQLARATEARPLVILLDALDQLSTAEGAWGLSWLPRELPPHVRIIVSTSTSSADSLEALEGRLPTANFEVLRAMSRKEGEDLLGVWLDQAERTLQTDQQKLVLARFASAIGGEGTEDVESGLPLYLKLAFEEARRWRSYDGVPKLNPTIQGVIRENLFARLSVEANHGEVFVHHALGYLAAAKNGLSEDEILEVLSRDPDVMADFQRRSPRSPRVPSLPVAVWSRFYFDLEPYLAERHADDTLVLAFHHTQMAKAVNDTYLSAQARPKYHQALAAYFRDTADPRSDASWKNPSPHALVELPYHLLTPGDPPGYALTELLTDVVYLNARTQVSDVWQLLDDYSTASGDLDEEAGDYRAFIAKHAQTLSRREGQLMALLHHEGPPRAKSKVAQAESKGLYTEAWLRTQKLEVRSPSRDDARVEVVEVVSSWDFPTSYVVGLAAEAQWAFHLVRLGVIGVVDIARARSVDEVITVRATRPLALIPSPDGRHLAVAFESGEADLLELVWSDHNIRSQRVVRTIQYQVPQFEAPTMHWVGHDLIYQKDRGGIFRLDATSQEGRNLFVAPDGDSAAELRSVATLNHNLVLALSAAPTTRLVLLEDGTCRPLCDIENADSVAVCACDSTTMAVALSNHEIRVFEITDGETRELARAAMKKTPICMAYSNESLLLGTDAGELFSWRFGQGGSPVMLQAPGTHTVSRFARDLAFSDDGTLVSVSQSTAEALSIGTGQRVDPGTIEDLFEVSGAPCAVVRAGTDLRLVRTASGAEIMLAENPEGIPRFCMDGADNLLYASSNGDGLVLDLHSESRCAVTGIPRTIAAVTGDPQGGFWIADRLGDIHRLETNGSLQLAWSSQSSGSRVQELLCAGATLVWRGWLEGRAESGEERLDTLLFFTADDGQHLRLRGQRSFDKSRGFIEAVTYDSSRDSVMVVLGNAAGGHRVIRQGTVDDFIARREIHGAIDGLRHCVMTATGTSGSSLYLLSDDGCIHCMDATNLTQKAVLSPSIPFQMMSKAGAHDDVVLLSDGQASVYSCRLECG